jgi:uncharacterized protein YjbI with pentapeptide repeats
MFLPRLKPNVPPVPETEIEKKAYEIWEECKAQGIQSSDAENWHQAKELLEQKQLNQSFWGIERVGTVVQQSFVWTEKRMVEPFANLLDKADIFRIVEKLSPVLEAAGVIMIPIVIWWMTDAGQKAKEETDKAARAQEAVKTYLNQLSTVFLDGNLEKDERLRTATRASTLALLKDPNLDGNRKGQVIEYLTELNLVQSAPIGSEQGEIAFKKPLISLASSDLNEANLNEANFRGANLSKANLRGANLSRANLNEANLNEANFRGAYLNRANLSRANLSGANLIEVDLNGASLVEADLSGVNLNRAYLVRAYLNRANLSGANLKGADLNGADLRGADLSGAYLKGADLSSAYLTGAYLWGADLSGAYLKGTKLCKTELPSNLKLDPNRNCEEMGITP